MLPFSTLHVCTIIAVLDILRHFGWYKNKFGIQIKNAILYLCLVMVYMLMIILIGNGSIVELYRLAAIAVELFHCACYISNQCERKGVSLDRILIHAAFIEGVIATAAYFIPNVQSILINNMIRNGYPDVYLSFAKYRLYGLSYSMLYGMPVINSLIGAYAVYYALKNKIIYLLMAGIILFSAIINARISIVPIAICFIYMIIILNKNRLTVKKYM